jgi:hypothetical protein
MGIAASLAVACAPAQAAAPAAQFDAPGQKAATACVHLAHSSAPLRFADGRPTGFLVSDHLSGRDSGCPPRTVRLDLHEVIPSPAGPLVFHRGGHRYTRAKRVKYGEIAVADLAGALPPPAAPTSGNGAPCTLAGGTPWKVRVRSIPRAMHYKPPGALASGSNRGASFMHYGDPGADQGSTHSIHYTYLLWSFVDVHGGGMARTLLAPGQVVYPCDVAAITMDSWNSSGAVNGTVTARYVGLLAGTDPLYGWMVWSHTYARDRAGPVAHAEQVALTAPGDDNPAPPA